MEIIHISINKDIDRHWNTVKQIKNFCYAQSQLCWFIKNFHSTYREFQKVQTYNSSRSAGVWSGVESCSQALPGVSESSRGVKLCGETSAPLLKCVCPCGWTIYLESREKWNSCFKGQRKWTKQKETGLSTQWKTVKYA